MMTVSSALSGLLLAPVLLELQQRVTTTQTQRSEVTQS
jgi:hypothetical protein